MAPILHCVRHAQGLHNISVANLGIHDPALTPAGEQQCAELAASFAFHSRISLIIASPLIRTLQTALLSFGPALANGRCVPTILALPEAQETSALISDTGSDLESLRETCQRNNWPVDLSLVQEDWNIKSSSKWAPTRDAIVERAKEARRVIRDQIRRLQAEGQDSPEIVFVAHGGFLHYFTDDWEDSGVDQAYQQGQTAMIRWDIPGTSWRNTEVRSYTIELNSIQQDTDVPLVEVPESRKRRGKTGQHRMQKLDIATLEEAPGPFQLQSTQMTLHLECFDYLSRFPPVIHAS